MLLLFFFLGRKTRRCSYEDNFLFQFAMYVCVHAVVAKICMYEDVCGERFSMNDFGTNFCELSGI